MNLIRLSIYYFNGLSEGVYIGPFIFAVIILFSLFIIMKNGYEFFKNFNEKGRFKDYLKSYYHESLNNYIEERLNRSRSQKLILILGLGAFVLSVYKYLDTGQRFMYPEIIVLSMLTTFDSVVKLYCFEGEFQKRLGE